MLMPRDAPCVCSTATMAAATIAAIIIDAAVRGDIPRTSPPVFVFVPGGMLNTNALPFGNSEKKLTNRPEHSFRS